MLTIEAATEQRPRLAYALRTALSVIGGWRFRLVPASDNQLVVIRHESQPGRIIVPVHPVSRSGAATTSLHCDDAWTAAPRIRAHALHVPCLGATGAPLPFVRDGDTFRAGFALFDAVWVLLAGQADAPETDEHGRPRSDRHLLVRNNSELLPLVDVYVHLLREVIAELWPDLVSDRANPPRPPLITHDVDRPWEHDVRSTAHRIMRSAANFLRDRDPELAMRRLVAMATRRDVMDTFDWICTRLEASDLQGIFNVFAGGDHPLDATYRLGDPKIDALLASLHQRGHEIGYHASYRTQEEPQRIAAEFAHLREYCAQLGIEQGRWGGRHHYLRWSAPLWNAWERAGLDWDSSAGFPDRPGFRLGTAHTFPAYSIAAEAPLSLDEKPLLLMDVSVRLYQGDDWSEIPHHAERLKDLTRKYGGQIVVLWHNDRLVWRQARRAYRQMLDVLTGA